MELFSGEAALSLMVATLGLPVAEPIDIMDNDNYDLLRPEVRRMVESRIEVEDPLLLSMAPVCGPSSPLQNLNEMREEYADNFYNLRQQWYPVVKWLTDLIKKRPSNGREVLLDIQDMDAEVHAGATGRSALQQLYRRAWSFSDWINVSMASMTTHHWTTSTKGHRTFAVFRAHEASTQKGLPSKSTT